MKERRIKIIIGLMAFAVIGLIGIQVFWLTNLIKVEEERFNCSVNNAMLATTAKLEKNEAAQLLVNKVWVGKNDRKPKSVKEFSLTGTHFNYFVHDTTQKTRIIKIENDDDNFVYQFRDDSVCENGVTQVKVVAVSPNPRMRVQVSSPKIVFEKQLDTFVTTKKRLVQNVVAEMIDVNIQRPIEKRLNVKTLDSVLTQEFASKGISSEFQFGILKVRQDSLTLLKKGTAVAELNKSNYRTLLFPGEVFTGINELRVYFPNKNSLILSSLVGMLALSIGFIALIVGVFLKTVQMFIRQKKITDVKNDLINNITHEFKTPISTISLACEALNEPALSAEKQSVARYSKIIREENERLQLMVDTLLNTASMERDEIKIERKEIDLEDIVSKVVSKFDETIRQREGSVTTETQNSCNTILGDKFHLTNAVSNLIDNALKFNEQKPEVKLTLSSESENVILAISDNGIGIPKESLEKIFETFYRVQSGNVQNVRGNGIGLSYAKKIIELHGGTISVVSLINIGTTFKITLPKQ